jgi:hypothetical protein
MIRLASVILTLVLCAGMAVYGKIALDLYGDGLAKMGPNEAARFLVQPDVVQSIVFNNILVFGLIGLAFVVTLGYLLWKLGERPRY